MRILLVEDDKVLADAVSRVLVQSAHAVDVVDTGEQADKALALDIYDLAILDIGLPGLSGLDVLKRLRARRSVTPVLMLTAFDALADRVRGLDLGADDYLAKPFDLPELEARVRALLRRGAKVTPTLEHGRLTFDTVGRRAYHDGKPVELTAYEFSILRALAQRPGHVLSREQLLDLAKGSAELSFDRSIDVHVSRLRAKLGDDSRSPRLLKTVRGAGYLLAGGD